MIASLREGFGALGMASLVYTYMHAMPATHSSITYIVERLPGKCIDYIQQY